MKRKAQYKKKIKTKLEKKNNNLANINQILSLLNLNDNKDDEDSKNKDNISINDKK